MAMPETSSPRSPLVTPANVLTAARLLLLPVAIYGVTTRRPEITLLTLFVAWSTDLADGLVARRHGPPGPLGRTLDTVVDFTFVAGLFLVLFLYGWIPTYQFLVLVGAKLAVLLLELPALRARHFEPLATRLGKPAGALAEIFLLTPLLRMEADWLAPGFQDPVLVRLQLVVFVALALLVVLNAVECVVKACRRP
jgi:phosphatidylglycerophosphate synthase